MFDAIKQALKASELFTNSDEEANVLKFITEEASDDTLQNNSNDILEEEY